MVGVLDNEPIRVKPSELLVPFKPKRLPAGLKSWQGNPADTTKTSLDDTPTELVGLTERDGFPSDSVSCDREPADSAE